MIEKKNNKHHSSLTSLGKRREGPKFLCGVCHALLSKKPVLRNVAPAHFLCVRLFDPRSAPSRIPVEGAHRPFRTATSNNAI